MKKIFYFMFIIIILNYSYTIETKKLVALTFDDGPSKYTYKIVKILKEYDIPATFFVVGSMVRDKPQTFQNIINDYEKIEIENHTFGHKNLRLLKDNEIYKELNDCNNIIKKHYNNEIKYFRPPYLSTNPRVENIAKQLGLNPVFGIGGNDTQKNTNANKVVTEIMQMLRDKNQIIILHDAGMNINITIQALPILIKGLKERNYEFVTLDEFYKK